MDDDKPRRKRRAKAVAIEIEQEPNLLMRVLLHSPKDTMACTVALAAMTAIVVNAMFLQAGHHPSPMFGAMPVEMTIATPAQPQPLPRPRPAETDAQPANVIDPQPMVAIPAAKPAAPAAVRPPAPVPAHKDPLGDLINANHRVISVQRVLTNYGYGQLKANGTLGPDTRAAIRQFEKDRHHPQTGQISDWLLAEMAKLTGKTIN
ncbi:peptidoglycan-binding protein [[Pseudomonas] carboxydohydrogena]|uniref:Peptidoglycan-binding protein n=1 Tax=Afipia carboxydohydrogena TaxID=290 RepID=A0ABY8BNQ8_AFICR|nr:peptidoglycan-binding domain-containing protein [[Pseudomonas] carboxydohydrogena]WEF50564.1 peptidoglycan-binding protein [[Pseudomonas] carboxydohydrogena]